MKPTNGNTDLTPRLKRKFSLESKKELCITWKESGMGKREFCRNHNIGISAFYGWCKKIFPKLTAQENPSNWVPIITTKRKMPLEEPEQAIIELSLPNHIVARIKVSSHKVGFFIQEICHAVAIIR